MASGIINLESTRNALEGRIVWNSNSNGSSANTSNIYAELQIRRNDGYTTTGTWNGNLNLGGKSEDFSHYGSIGNDWVKVKSLSNIIRHNDNGTGSCWIYGRCNGPSGTSMSGEYVNGEKTVTLDKIPRYLTIKSFIISNRTLNTVVVAWSTSDARSSTLFSLNGGSWIGSSTYGESLASDQKSGTFNIKNLNPNTNYKLKIKCIRTDSGLETESNEISFTTYDIAKLTEVPNINISESHTITWTNPSGAALSLKLCKTDNTQIISYGTVIGTSKAITPTASTIYALTPNSNKYIARYILTTTQNGKSYTHSKDFTFTVTNSNPIIGTVEYKDINSAVVNITGSNKRIVRNKSNLQFVLGVATAKNGATISKYQVEFNGTVKSRTTAGTIDFGIVNASYNLTAKATVIDSRGNKATKNITVIIDDWILPSAIISLSRLNNYEDETYLIIDGNCSSVNGKNSMKIQYKYKKNESGGTFSELITVADNVKQTLNLAKESSWNFTIIITDLFESRKYENVILPIGMPMVFYDTKLLSFGVNCFPSHEKSFEVDGNVYVKGNINLNEKKVLSFNVKGSWN